MILKKITLKDFRPYYEIQEIEFVNGEQNITLIKAENGTGKTTLLEAFRWCLYGDKLNLPNPNNFLNERAAVEMNLNTTRDVSVRLEFQEGDVLYTISRTLTFKKTNKGLSKVEGSVSLISSDGIKSCNEKAVLDKIQELVPKEINFFFDGERLKRMESSTEIRDSIIKVLKIKTLENSKKDIESIRRDLEKEISKNDEQSSKCKIELTNRDKLEKRKKEVEEKIEKLNFQMKEFKKRKEERQEEQKTITENIKTNVDLNSRLTKLEIKYEDNKRILSDKIKKYKEGLSKNGYLLLSTKILKEAKDILKESSNRGYLPSNVKDTLIEEILKNRTCICGNKVEYNSDEERILNEILEKNTVTSDDEELFFEIKSKVSNSLKKIKDPLELFEEFSKLKRDIFQLEFEIKNQENELDDIRKSYNKDEMDFYYEIEKIIKDIEQNIERNSAQICQLSKEIGEINSNLQSCENRIRIYEKDLNINNDDKKTIDIIRKVEEVLGKLYEMKLEKERNNLEKKLRKIYDQVTRKGYLPQITKNFDMKIKKHYLLDEEVSLSEGEHKILTLCFIGALVDLARDLERSKEDTDTGGIYPIVLDSPYGDLDVDHKLQITNVIHSLSDQIVIFASSSQWTNDVNDQIKHKVGKIYTLINKNPKNTQNNINYEFTKVLKQEGVYNV